MDSLNDSRVVDPSRSHFIKMLTLDNLNPSKIILLCEIKSSLKIWWCDSGVIRCLGKWFDNTSFAFSIICKENKLMHYWNGF